MAGKSRGIDTYATRHCPVVIYRNEKKVAEYPSISECAKKMGMTPAKVKSTIGTATITYQAMLSPCFLLRRRRWATR